ncbi:MAG: hypothetical protein JXR96_30145 [Deltaproteobacteria bacterium]|nr:hypothetical protein [Deltaproteobacteria bacterium]
MIPEFPLDVPSHDGQPNEPDDVFFGEIGEIGKLLSANTNLNLTRGFRRWTGKRIGMILVGLILGPLVGAIVAAVLHEGLGVKEETALAVGLGGFALVGAVLFGYWFRPWQEATFVGEGGLAKVRRRDGKVQKTILCFADAAELRQRQIRQYVNGVYSGTQFFFDWLGEDGYSRFKINGVFRESARKPVPRENGIHFASSAEAAWLHYRLPKVLEQVERGGTVRFNVGKGKWIDIGKGWVEFGLKKEPRRLEPADVKEISLQQGWLSVKPAQGGWGSTLKASVGDIGDMKIFLALLENALNVKL